MSVDKKIKRIRPSVLNEKSQGSQGQYLFSIHTVQEVLK
jgi:hypothetical protein